MKLALILTLLCLGLVAQARVMDILEVQKLNGEIKVTVDVHQEAKGKLDLLFVVDNSGSMTAYQDAFAKSANSFVSGLNTSGAGLHVGVISTTMDLNGQKGSAGIMNGGVLTGDQASFSSELYHRLMLGVDGSGFEEIFTPIIAALTPPNSETLNAGFLRADADLGIVILTDADDQSPLSSGDFYKKLIEIKGGHADKIRLASIYSPSNGPCYFDDPQVMSKKLEEMLVLSKAKTLNICAPDLAQNVEALAKSLAPIENLGVPSVMLPSEPVLDSVKVLLDGKVLVRGDLHYGWVLDAKRKILIGDKVDFTQLSAGAKIEITYEPLSWEKK